MYIDSDSSKDSRESTINERRDDAAADRDAVVTLLSRAIREHIVDDAPLDLDEVMSKVPRSAGWVRALALVSALGGLWTIIILAVRALLH